MFTPQTPDSIEGSVTLEEALDRLIGELPQTEETKTTFKLHRKVDEMPRAQSLLMSRQCMPAYKNSQKHIR